MAARKACEKKFYDLVSHISPVLPIIHTRPYFLARKVCVLSQTRLRYVNCHTIAHDGASQSISEETEKTVAPKKRPIWYYDNKGIRQRKIDQLMRKASELTKTGDTTTAKEDVIHMKNLLNVFSKSEFNEKEINSLLVDKPRLFGLTKQKLYNCMMDLQDYGYPKSTIKKMVMKSPGLLLVDEKEFSIQKRLSILQQLDLTPKLSLDRCIYLAQKCPQLLTLKDISDLQGKLKSLKRLGLNEQLVYELVMKYPNVLTMSVKSIEEKVNYVKRKLGGRASHFVKFPRAFSSSLLRIKERHHYLMSEGYMKDSTMLSERKLRAIVLTTDKDFIYRVTNTRMKDYREFQQQFRKEETEKELDALTDERCELASRVKKLGSAENELDVESRVQNDDIDTVDKKLFGAFKHSKQIGDEEWYNTPFPEVDYNQEYFDMDDEPKKRKRRGYKPMKKKQFRKMAR